MKGFMFLFSGVFWGIVIVLVGAAVLLKAVFKIDLPIFSLFWGLFLIYLGACLVLGGRFVGSGLRSGHAVVFGSGELAFDEKVREYNIVFSAGRVDLRGLSRAGEGARVKVNTVFAKNEVQVPKDADIALEVNTAFGATILPDGSMASSFGKTLTRTKPTAKGAPKFTVEINSVFGQTDLKAD